MRANVIIAIFKLPLRNYTFFGFIDCFFAIVDSEVHLKGHTIEEKVETLLLHSYRLLPTLYTRHSVRRAGL